MRRQTASWAARARTPRARASSLSAGSARWACASVRRISRQTDPIELVDIAQTLLIAGHVTTSSMIAYGTLALLENRDQLTVFREADQEEIPNFIEELLRFISLDTGMLPRVATIEIEIGGRRISEGDAVFVATGVANYDETLVERPDELDLHRSTPVRHLSFGHGIHHCLGHNLARAELQIALSALMGRLPSLRMAVPADRITITPGSGPDSLPVTW
ncbi:cytochrome P450 [Nocardia rhamnosiphila]